MSTLTVRIRPHSYQVLQDLAKERDESLPDTLDRLIEESRRRHILDKANEAYAAVAADPEADAAWRAEIALWDGTLADGLEPEDWDAPE